MEEMEIEIAGITYELQIDVDDDYVISVFSVAVWDGKKEHEIKMTQKQLDKFYEANQDALNEKYRDELIAKAEMAGEEQWERQNDR